MEEEREQEQGGQDDRDGGRQEEESRRSEEEENGGDGGAGSQQEQQEPEGWEDIEISADHDWSQGPPEGIRERIKDLTGRTRDLEREVELDGKDRQELIRLRGQLEVYEKQTNVNKQETEKGKGKKEDEFKLTPMEDYNKIVGTTDNPNPDSLNHTIQLMRRDSETITRRVIKEMMDTHTESQKEAIEDRGKEIEAVHNAFEKAEKNFGGGKFGHILDPKTKKPDTKSPLRKRADEIYDNDEDLRKSGAYGIYQAFAQAAVELAGNIAAGGGKERSPVDKIGGKSGSGGSGGGGSGGGNPPKKGGKFHRHLRKKEYRDLPTEDQDAYDLWESDMKDQGKWDSM